MFKGKDIIERIKKILLEIVKLYYDEINN